METFLVLILTFSNISFTVLMSDRGIGSKKLLGLSDARHSDTSLIAMVSPFSSAPHKLFSVMSEATAPVAIFTSLGEPLERSKGSTHWPPNIPVIFFTAEFHLMLAAFTFACEG